jgi:hypothetical protein
MKVIINKLIPMKGYVAMTTWPFIFARKELNKYILNHENIHGEQQKELLIIPFYVLYILEYLIKICITFSTSKAYYSISFEQEANRYEHELDYIKHRTHYIWIKYIFKVWK